MSRGTQNQANSKPKKNLLKTRCQIYALLACAQAWQMQARFLAAGASLASNACEKSMLVHQHGPSKEPLCTEAHWLGCPHKGHSGVGSGLIEAAAGLGGNPVTFTRGGLATFMLPL
jgi:hypothetical protein